MRNIHHSGPGRSQRQLRVGETIRRELAEILTQGELHEPELEGVSITVGEVQASPDLRIATVHVLPLGGEGAEAVVAILARNAGRLRALLARRVRLKYTPELRFRADPTFDRLDQARAMFADPKVRRDVEGD